MWDMHNNERTRMAGSGAQPSEGMNRCAEPTGPRAGEDRDELFFGRKVRYPEARPPTHNDRRAYPASRGYDSYQPPANVRHSFRREHNDSSADYRRGRQDDRRNIYRGQASSPYSARRASPPLCSDPSGYTHAPRRVSPVKERLPSKDSTQPLLHQNPSWKKQDQTQFLASATTSSPMGSENPKHQSAATVDDAELHSHRPEPHIFISAADLPANTSTSRHLSAFLRGFRFELVFWDPKGHYITFSDTSAGREELVRCAEYTTHAVMFRQFHLRSTAYYNCQRVKDLRQLCAASSAAARSRPSSPGISILDRAAKQPSSPVQNAEHAISDHVVTSVILRPLSATPDIQPGLSSTDQGEVSHGSKSAFVEVGSNAMPTPSLALPSHAGHPRSDDDVSTISGTTSSSRSKIAKCHVCSGLGGSISRCKTCSAHYHKHCRPNGSRPQTEQLYWQCDTCVRKGKVPVAKVVNIEASTMNGVDGTIPDTQPAEPHVAEKMVDLSTYVMGDAFAGPSDQTEQARAPVAAEQSHETDEQNKGKFKRNAASMMVDHDSDEHVPKKRARMEMPVETPKDPIVESQASSNLAESQSALAASHAGSEADAVTTTPREPQSVPATKRSTRQPGHEANDGLALELLPEAQLLVERSFAAAPACPNDAVKTKKLKFKRVKLSAASQKTFDNLDGNAPSGLAQADQQDQIFADQDIDRAVDTHPRETEAETSRPGNNDRATTGDTEPTEPAPETLLLLACRDAVRSMDPLADGVIQPTTVKSSAPAKARRSKITRTKCNSCGKNNVPFNPTVKAVCFLCRNKTADKVIQSAAIPAREQNEQHQQPIRNNNTADKFARLEGVATSGMPTAQDRNDQAMSQGAIADQVTRSSALPASGVSASEPHERGASREKTPSAQIASPPAVASPECNQEHVIQHDPEPNGGLKPGDIGHPDGSSQFKAQVDSPLAEAQPVGSLREDDNGAADGDVVDSSKPNMQHRKSQRANATDHHDLGNSLRRPKNTYMRLIGMALCAAEEHTATPRWVTRWVADNIPGYRLDQGSWVSNLEASMCLNASGRNGKIILTSTETRLSEPGQTRPRKMYGLLPGLEDQLEQWDEALQQPRSPTSTRTRDFADDDATAPEDVDPEADATNSQSNRTREASTPDADMDLSDVEIDNAQPRRAKSATIMAAVTADQELIDDFPEDDGPLSRQNRHIPGATMPSASRSPAKHAISPVRPPVPGALQQHEFVPPVSDRQPSASRSPAKRVTRPNPASASAASGDGQKPEPPFLDEAEEQALLQMLDEDIKTRKHTSLSLFAYRPQHDPKTEIAQRDKIAEIARRPRRKEIFGKPPGHSVLGFTPIFPPQWSCPASATGSSEASSVLGNKRNLAISEKPRSRLLDLRPDGTQIELFDTLEDFLNVPDGLVPAIMDRQLVYRHGAGMSRTVYRTGI
ncbi:hypothetical protein CERZMDRAFT_87221 [Cercospora zeae-maydis SCOH1-5]|uniref:Fork-head domain-containing protein n=1 Tax=Cercospora zeae-maydis SCOH1-5 TaxID=717836 RepID=A0A6A6F5D0_9PEZI|nr:hypothetical protein CERZMDRAFT_87221 [Cercospora zeae-maydis SCOH1-5]